MAFHYSIPALSRLKQQKIKSSWPLEAKAHTKIRERGKRVKGETRKKGGGERGKITYLVSTEYFDKILLTLTFIYNPMINNLNFITKHKCATRNGAPHGLKTELE